MDLDGNTGSEKRAELTRDRLSELPDRTLVHILSHLHTEEAARTSILSKRFNSLWNSVDSLKFSDEYYSGKNVVAFLFMVKSLHLNFKHNKGAIILRYRLGKFLYNNVNLLRLVTQYCNFPTQGEISCRRLKFLSITKTKLNRDVISRILSGLELTYCWGVDKFKIDSSSSLKVLRIVGEQHLKDDIIEQGDDRVLMISGPNLVSLEVSGFLYKTSIRLNDLGSLVNAVMAFTVLPIDKRRNKSQWFTTRDEEITKEVLESLRCVKALSIGGSIVKRVVEHTKVSPVQSDIEKSYWKSWSTISKCPLLYLKTVKVVGFQVSCRPIKPLFQFLEFLLANSKELEEIVIQASRYVTRAALNAAMELLSVPTASPDVIVRLNLLIFGLIPSVCTKMLLLPTILMSFIFHVSQSVPLQVCTSSELLQCEKLKGRVLSPFVVLPGLKEVV